METGKSRKLGKKGCGLNDNKLVGHERLLVHEPAEWEKNKTGVYICRVYCIKICNEN